MIECALVNIYAKTSRNISLGNNPCDAYRSHHTKHPQKQEFLNYHKVISKVWDAFNKALKKTSNIIIRGSAFNTEFTREPEEGDTPSDTTPALK